LKAEGGRTGVSKEDKRQAKEDAAIEDAKRSKNDPPPPTKSELKAIAKDEAKKEAEMAKNRAEDATDMDK